MPKRLLRSLLSAAATAAICLGAVVPTHASSARSGCSTFDATGLEVCFEFLDYWAAHGGLAQQGYPITPTLQERSPTDGQVYTVQYFERAVFELHPENPEPNNVLLSLLGRFSYSEKYPNGAPGQQANSSGGSVLFKETGKRVGGRFLQYWQQNGGLAQQGYPISEEFTEKSELDGKEYRVQYFERAVFELHPENKPPYDLLLSQLGTMRKQERQGTMISFTTDDGVKLIGSRYGKGKAGVILSAMCAGDAKAEWTDFALALQRRGYMVLSYHYRGFKPSEGEHVINKLDHDIEGAVGYMRAQGVERLVLAGASCGGTISTIMATRTKVDALIVIASPGGIDGMEASDQALKGITAPKLFISAEEDRWTEPMVQLYDKVPAPKEKHIYPGGAHGTRLFYTEHAGDLSQRLLGFIEKHAPAR